MNRNKRETLALSPQLYSNERSKDFLKPWIETKKVKHRFRKKGGAQGDKPKSVPLISSGLQPGHLSEEAAKEEV